MNPVRQRVRHWWQPPRRISERPAHRQISFLELFYDLVYVVLIAELSHALSMHVTWSGLGSFAFLFVIVWWAWFNGSSYHDLHGNNDIRTRVFTFLQMLTVVAMAVFAHDALGKTSVGFGLSYAAFQLILTFLWWRTGVHDPSHRLLSVPYSAVFLVTTLLFAVSPFVPSPARFYLWGAALLISLLLPLFIVNLGRINPKAQTQIDYLAAVSASLVERFGLFTIIVLGEVIVGVVVGVTQHRQLSWLVAGAAALCTLIAIGLWWLYFDFVSHRLPRSGITTTAAWFYFHLPLTIGITAVGAAVLNVLENPEAYLPAEVRWLLVAAIAIALAAIKGLMRTIQVSDKAQRIYRAGGRAMLVSIVLIVALGFFNLHVIAFLLCSVLLTLAPVCCAFPVWVKMLEQSETDRWPSTE